MIRELLNKKRVLLDINEGTNIEINGQKVIRKHLKKLVNANGGLA